MRRTRTLIGLLTVGALIWTAAPASATPPEIFRFSENNYDNPDVFQDECGEGVDLIGVFDVQGSETVFFDADGNPIRVLVHVVFNGELTRSDTGNTIKDPGRVTLEIDLVTGVETITGLIYNMVYPGMGTVFQNIGRRVLVPGEGPVFVAGPDDFLEGQFAFEEACNALA